MFKRSRSIKEGNESAVSSSNGRGGWLNPRPLLPGYSAEVDSITREAWYDTLCDFHDSNIYQTWDYDSVRRRGGGLSHLLLRKDDKVVAIAQSRIVRLPFVNAGIAYVRWGPLWHSKTAKDVTPDIFGQALRALRNEYVCRRGLLLRVLPIAFQQEDLPLLETLIAEKFSIINNDKRQTTLLLDLRSGLEDLRKGLDQKWRNCLNRAQKNNLTVIEGDDDRLFGDFIDIYKEMHDRKGFVESSDVNEFRRIQQCLPKEYKLRIFLCYQDDIPCAGVICSAIGKTGIYMFGATSNVGMKTNGSYLLQWKVVEWLKNRGCTVYDLHGIDKVKNPGTYHFKAGLCAKNGKEVQFLGQFEEANRIASRLVVKCGEYSREILGNLRRFGGNQLGRLIATK